MCMRAYPHRNANMHGRTHSCADSSIGKPAHAQRARRAAARAGNARGCLRRRSRPRGGIQLSLAWLLALPEKSSKYVRVPLVDGDPRLGNHDCSQSVRSAGRAARLTQSTQNGPTPTAEAEEYPRGPAVHPRSGLVWHREHNRTFSDECGTIDYLAQS
jgi:hypothetical protein